MEAVEELPKKAKLFFVHAADKWDADFYAKVNDDVYVNIGQYHLDLLRLLFNVWHPASVCSLRRHIGNFGLPQYCS